MRTDPESFRWSSLQLHEVTPSDLHGHQTHTITDRPVITSLSILSNIISFFEPTHAFARMLPFTRALQQTTIKQDKCQTENTRTHILYKHGRHTWPSAASPEAKRVKGYLCSSKDPSAFWTCFQAASNEIGSASQCSLSEEILGLSTADRKPEGTKKQKAIGFLQLTVRAVIVVVNNMSQH